MAASHRASATLLLPFLAPLVVLLFFSAAAATAAAQAAAGEHAGNGTTMTHLHFYFHEVFTSGPNGTTAQVAPPVRGNGSFFGFVGVVDDMLREGADPSSRLIGRAQGLTAGASLSDGAILTTLNFVFTDGPYSGSTLAVFGRALLGTVMERPVVGGTGAFRMARGYTLSRMLNSTDPENLLVLEYDAYVWH